MRNYRYLSFSLYSMLLIGCFCSLFISVHALKSEAYHEQLAVTSLPGDSLAATLDFSIWRNSTPSQRQKSSSASGGPEEHYVVFPRPMHQLMTRYGLEELSLTLTQGRWRHGQWGYPGKPLPTGTGAHVVAWFDPTADRRGTGGGTRPSAQPSTGQRSVDGASADPNESGAIDNDWHDLINALSGMFCASLESIDKGLTVAEWLWEAPASAARRDPRNSRSGDTAGLKPDKIVRYGSLPSESLCTENLTPWKKLLPCKSMAGFAGLLHPTVIISSNFLSLGVRVKRLSFPDGTTGLELVMSLHIVTAQPELHRGKFTLGDVFLARTPKLCPLAARTRLAIEMGPAEPKAKLEKAVDGASANSSALAGKGEQSQPFPVQPSETLMIAGRRWAVFNLRSDHDVQAAINQAFTPVPTSIQGPAPLSLHCYLSGTGQHHGSIICDISHRIPADTPIVYAHVIPWYLRVYFHSLRMTCKSTIDQPGKMEVWNTNPVKYANYRPGKFRERSHFLEFHATLPAQSKCSVSLRFEKLLLRWTEYPPDANHGFWIPPPVIKTDMPAHLAFGRVVTPWEGAACCNGSTGGAAKGGGGSLETSGLGGAPRVRMMIWGEILLANLPTPDFSMPYNVICLVCTVVALAFGPIHNLTTKSMTLKDPKELEAGRLRAKLKRLKERVGAKLATKFRGRKSQMSDEQTSSQNKPGNDGGTTGKIKKDS